MIEQSRRDFLRNTVVGAGAAYLSTTALNTTANAAPAPITAKGAADIVTLGKSGIKASFLAQGTGYNGSARSSDHTRMGTAAFEKLVRYGLDQGIRFYETADLYGTHSYLRSALRQFKRDDLTLLSKLWPRQDYWNVPSANGKAEVQRFCREMGTDRLDIVLLHCMMEGNWAEKFSSIREGLADMKQKGNLRAVGVSCHNLDALKLAAKDPWVDVIFARINNKGESMDGQPDVVAPVLKEARVNGKCVVGMKIFGAGKLTSPEQKDASLKYVFSNQLVDAVTIGMKTTEEVDDTIQRIGKALVA